METRTPGSASGPQKRTGGNADTALRADSTKEKGMAANTKVPPAGVLMASTPPTGILRSSMRIWRRHPWISTRANMVGRSHEIFNTPELAREHFFSPYTPDEIVESCAARVEPESMRAVFIDQLFGLPRIDRISTPLLVLGAEDDGMVSKNEVRSTARAYGTGAVLFPRMGHNMMVEPGWRDVAGRIREWLADRGL